MRKKVFTEFIKNDSYIKNASKMIHTRWIMRNDNHTITWVRVWKTFFLEFTETLNLKATEVLWMELTPNELSILFDI